MEELLEEYGELLMGIMAVIFISWLFYHSLSEDGILYGLLQYWGQMA